MLQLGIENKGKHLISRGMQLVFEHNGLYHTALRFAPLANHVPHFLVENALNAWGAEREMPHFAQHTFDSLYKDYRQKKQNPQTKEDESHVK